MTLFSIYANLFNIMLLPSICWHILLSLDYIKKI